MSIPVPRLDDRTFQDLVDDAKRRVADYCPEWTDHNVSDPGVTLIELFATMTEEVIYRLNRAPTGMLLTFMNLIGMRLQPGRPARTGLTFWLAAPAKLWESAEDLHVVSGPGVEVLTERPAAGGAPVSFRTTAELRFPRAEVIGRYLGPADGDASATPVRVEGAAAVPIFGAGAPRPGSSFLLELARPLPGCAIRLELACEPNRGTGVEPDDPPLAWEAWARGRWQPCEVDRDTTGGLNREGAVFVHVPLDHADVVLPRTTSSSWLRCRVRRSRPDQPAYEESPVVGEVSAQTIGVTVPATQTDVVVRDEVIGVSDGTYGQPPFTVRHAPLVEDGSGGPLLLAGDDPEPWRPVTDLRASGEHDRHYLVDRVGGEIRLGVAVRETDGTTRRYGLVPPAAAPLRIPEYRVGGGVRGNVRATAVHVPRSPLPGVRRVENRHPAAGGLDPETVDQAVARVPLFLRQRSRAVTVSDFADLAREADVSVARSHALAAGDPRTSIGVRVLVVPELPTGVGVDAPIPEPVLSDVPETLERVSHYLDERRMVGVHVYVSPPAYVPVRVRARLRARPSADPLQVQRAALGSLHGLLHPLTGGEDGRGWPFGVDVQVGDVYAALHRVPGVQRVLDLTLHQPDDAEVGTLDVPSNALPLSLEHAVELA